MNYDDVRRHVEPFPDIAGVTVGSLTKAILKKWLIWLAGRKATRQKKDGTIIVGKTLSGRRANSVVQSDTVAVRWAVDNKVKIAPFRFAPLRNFFGTDRPFLRREKSQFKN